METYQFELTGSSDLIMHADNIEGADRVKRWISDPANKNVSIPGDDRTPPWTWSTYLYIHDGAVVMPAGNLIRALVTAGAKIPLKGRETLKKVVAHGMLIENGFCEFLCAGNPISEATINAIADDRNTFEFQQEAVKKLGFELFVVRALVGASKHVRVRPKFPQWTVRGRVIVWDGALTLQRLQALFERCGSVAGLGDWRPSAPKSPGPYGRFTAEVTAV